MRPALSVVIAVQGGAERLTEVLDCLLPQCDEQVEVLVCYAAEETSVPRLCAGRSVRTLAGEQGALIPHLWRDGIRAARADRVALSIVHCRPRPDWVGRLKAADLGTFAGIGGGLENEPHSDALGWAVFMLRYAPYAPPFVARETGDLPGDNAVYDRKALLAHESAFESGFWEPEIHARLLREGRRLLLDPELLSVHANGYGALDFAKQRFLHGTRFGFDRARQMGAARRLAQLVLSPLVPTVFGAKVARTALKHEALRGHLAQALPYLTLFVHAWALGEALGTARALANKP